MFFLGDDGIHSISRQQWIVFTYETHDISGTIFTITTYYYCVCLPSDYYVQDECQRWYIVSIPRQKKKKNKRSQKKKEPYLCTKTCDSSPFCTCLQRKLYLQFQYLYLLLSLRSLRLTTINTCVLLLLSSALLNWGAPSARKASARSLPRLCHGSEG